VLYHLLSWKWDNYGVPIPQTKLEQNMMQIELELTTTLITTKLLQKEVSESHKTLGTHKCIFGSEDAHYQVLVDKSKNLIGRAVKGQFNRGQAKLAL
jgi:hypothetical protein